MILKYLPLIAAIYIFFCIETVYAQTDTLFTAFWNLENLFDTADDPGIIDEEFLPSSKKGWNEERFNKKCSNLSEVIKSMNNGKGPQILGVCETENKGVVDTLIKKYLKFRKYNLAYLESPDERGIDNGLMYDDDLFDLLKVRLLEIELPDKYPTRGIFEAELLFNKKDTLHIFVNHWPSRRSGEKSSEINRITAAEVNKKAVEECSSKDLDAYVIIMGDFNDEPENISLSNTLGAVEYNCNESESGNLLNLAYSQSIKGEGSYKYRDQWNMLDQIIISHSLANNGNINYICPSFEVYKPDFLVTKSGKYAGTPIPVYGGDHYLGGYSDHFPVTAKFLVNRR